MCHHMDSFISAHSSSQDHNKFISRGRRRFLCRYVLVSSCQKPQTLGLPLDNVRINWMVLILESCFILIEPIAKDRDRYSSGSGNPVFSKYSGPPLPDQVEDKFRGGDTFFEFCNCLDRQIFIPRYSS